MLLDWEKFRYAIPWVPLLTRSIFVGFRFRNQMNELLCEQELARATHRSHIIALAGFSFSGLFALIVLQATLRQNLHFAIYCLLASFLCYLFSLNLQSYKSKRWHDQFGTAITEVAYLSLLLSIIGILYSFGFNPGFVIALSAFALSVWVIDHTIRLRIQSVYLKTRRDVQMDAKKKKELDFVTCPIHNIQYPAGGSCPRCDAEKQKK